MAKGGIDIRLDPEDWRSFQRAIKRNPRKAREEGLKFLARGLAVYNRNIIRNPWEMGGGGGGAPVDTGHLRDSHMRMIEPSMRGELEAIIIPTAPYAQYVHEGTSRMKARPWLEHAKKQGQKEIDKLADQMLKKLRDDLAK